MGKIGFVDVVGWALVLLWLVVSSIAVTIGDWPLFQSAGALGICAGVIYFVLQRHATPYPYGALEMQAAFQRHLAVLSDGIKVSNANTALIAKALVMEASRNGTEPNKILQKLADEPIDVIARSLEGRTGTLIERIDALEVRSLSSNAAILRSRHVSELFQAIVVVLGTLQGGFGAHFHRLMG